MTAKHKPLVRLIALSFSALLFLANIDASAQDATAQTKAEIRRLQQSLKEKPIANSDLADLAKGIEKGLNDADFARSGGRLYLSLENLGQAEDYFHAVRTVEAKADAIKDNLPAFEAEWGKASLEYATLDKHARQRNWDRFPAAVRALSEAAQGRTIPLLEGSRGFATATKPQDGLAYMGEAKGEAAYGTFLYGLDISRRGVPFPLRSVLPELEALQQKTNAAFQPPRSIDMHPRFIALNSTLKFARELDSSTSYAGALYQYLEATRHYGMLDPIVPDDAKQMALRRQVADEYKKISASKRDDSIAQIFLEKANGWLNKPEGAAPSSDEWRSIRVIVEQVLPAYYAALKPAAPLQQRAGKTATLTLVRWPYT
ncbi:MAG TPA: hypothetical protein VGQ12_09460 [Candidatus Angelobacter sp.]|nr:hypothetical protein [Candidatus Angelobacter sp.]